MTDKILEVRGLTKTYGGEKRKGAKQAAPTLDVLRGIDIDIYRGDVVCLIGPSGCGKSTFLRCLNRLEIPTGGSIKFEGVEVDDDHIDSVRQKMGMVFQHFNLFPHLTVKQNLCLAPELLKLKSKEEASKRAEELLARVGLSDKANVFPKSLSGGQQQRIAIARALATNPKVLLCDEATSALDPKTTRQILELIRDINRQLGITVVVITHQMSVVKEICTHVAILDDGEVVEDGMVSTVFSAPRSQAARHLVFPGGADAAVSDPSQERRIRLIFRSAQTTAIPMVARLAAEESIYANVISASTQKLSEEIYGSMLLGVPRGQLDRAMGFFRSIPNLQAEEVSVDVH